MSYGREARSHIMKPKRKPLNRFVQELELSLVAFPAPYLISTCIHMFSLLLPMPFLSDNSFPICEKAALEGVMTNVKEVKTGAESISCVKWTNVFSPFYLSTLTVQRADLIIMPV